MILRTNKTWTENSIILILKRKIIFEKKGKLDLLKDLKIRKHKKMENKKKKWNLWINNQKNNNQ